jgi:hypothetical protein
LVWTSDDPDGPGGCPPLQLDTIVEVFGPATAQITSPVSVCDNVELQLSVTTNTTTGTWSTTEGTGTIEDADENSTTYIPSQTDYLLPSIEFFFIIPDPDGAAGPCEGLTETIEVEVNQAPTADAGENDTLCSGSTLPLLVGLPAGGSWTSNVLPSGQFQPTGNGIGAFESYYTYTDNEGCVDVDTVVVNVFPTATASAGGPYPICGGGAVALNAGTNGFGEWTTNGSGVFSSDSDTSATYTPSLNDIGTTVQVTWTTFDPDGQGGPCLAATATANVIITAPATGNTTTPITICSSDEADLSVVTTPITGSWTGGDGTFLNPNVAVTNYTPDPNDVGQIVLYWTTLDPDSTGVNADGPCTSIVVEQIVNVLDAATANAGPDMYSCGLDSIELVGSANGNGEWTGGLGNFADSSETTTYYYPVAAEVGQVILLTWTTFDPDSISELDNGPCTGAFDVVSIQINEPAFADIEDIAPICSNGDAELTVDSYPADGTWDGGGGQYGSSTQSNTTYSPAPNEQAIVIPITWTTDDPDGLGPTGPCEPFIATAEIDILAEAISDITTTYSVCANGTLDINVQENGDGQWTVDPAIAGTFADSSLSSTQFIPSVDYYTAQNLEIKWTTFDPDAGGPCLFDADSTSVSILPLPQINMAPNFSIPCGDDISATVSTYQNVPYTFTWTPQAGLISPSQLVTPVVGDDDFALQVTDANGCINADTTTVDAIALANMASASNASTCLYVPIELSGVAADGQGPFTYNWVVTEIGRAHV